MLVGQGTELEEGLICEEVSVREVVAGIVGYWQR